MGAAPAHLGAAAAPPPAWPLVLLAATGSLTVVPPAAALLAVPLGAAAGWFYARVDLAADAQRARREFRHALAGYLELVTILMAGGAGVETAMFDAADVGHGPAFRHLRAALSAAQARREPPWRALGQLGDQLGVGELEELEASMTLAGEGAQVRDSLTAKAAAHPAQGPRPARDRSPGPLRDDGPAGGVDVRRLPRPHRLPGARRALHAMTLDPLARGVPAHPDPTLPTGPTERRTDHAGVPSPTAHRVVAGRRHVRQRLHDARDDERGEVTATTALIVILVIAAIAAGGVIATKITNNANNVPEP